MIGALSSFVELFAAVYITMAVNNDFFSQFCLHNTIKKWKAS